ncbi:MAG TPA: hypothetical protein VNV37_05550 [Solirubrobacteraceae bacterium]|nr:hypothetical protein [Solirubrobacteraceae bacterium]
MIAFALIGIVAMQLWVMKLGAGIGRALDHTQLLARENSALEIENSALSSAARIERLALAKGMVPASPGALRFLTPRGPLDARLAAAALARPTQPSSSSSSTTSSEEAPATPGNEAAASPAEATGAAATGAQGPATEAPAGGG